MVFKIETRDCYGHFHIFIFSYNRVEFFLELFDSFFIFKHTGSLINSFRAMAVILRLTFGVIF
jgi:hypothetical protein